MDWGIVHSGLLDELEKIKLGEFSLQGLSPQTVIERGQPAPPMETSALNKAMQILTRYDQLTAGQEEMKTAGAMPFNPALPAFDTVTSTKKRKRKSGDTHVHVIHAPVDNVKSVGAHVIGGAGAGKLVAEWLAGRALPTAQKQWSKRWWGATLGAAVGGSEFARKRVSEVMKYKKQLQQADHSKTPTMSAAPPMPKMKAAAAFTTPAMGLKATRQVGVPKIHTGKVGPGIHPTKV
jgi:hypothetical protein